METCASSRPSKYSENAGMVKRCPRGIITARLCRADDSNEKVQKYRTKFSGLNSSIEHRISCMVGRKWISGFSTAIVDMDSYSHKYRHTCKRSFLHRTMSELHADLHQHRKGKTVEFKRWNWKSEPMSDGSRGN